MTRTALALIDPEYVRGALYDGVDDDTGTGAPAPSPRDRWRPPPVARRAPAIGCWHGPQLACVEYAPDAPEWRHPATWRRHLGDVAIRLEAITDLDAHAHGRVLGEWAAGVEPVRYDEAPGVVDLQVGGRRVRCSLLTVVEGVAQYAPSPAGLAWIRGLR